MKKIVILHLVLWISLVGFSQNEFPDFSNCYYLSHSNSEAKMYSLVVVARAGCDYSNDAIKDLVSLSNDTNLSILIYEFGDLSTIRFLHEEFFDYFPFIHANSCNYYSNDYSPVLFLYKNNLLIWKKEGWTPKYLKKIQHKIKSS